LREIARTPADRAWNLLNKSSSDAGKTGMVGKIVRLFPNHPKVRYEWPAHEQVVGSLHRAGIPIFDSDIEIIHTGYSDPETNKRKQARNLAILEKQIAADPACDAMLRYLAAGALLDLDRTAEALAAYRECAERTTEGCEIFEASRVRQATCLAKLGRHREALELAPAVSAEEWHPELLVQLGECAIRTGQIAQGLQWMYAAIGSPFRAWIPAHDPVKTKTRALQGIATLMQQNDPARAVAMLRLALECVKTGREPQPAEVLSIGAGA
jgi:tetratricopeptide (TPR) repeat protein